jgi:hypothetical protein
VVALIACLLRGRAIARSGAKKLSRDILAAGKKIGTSLGPAGPSYALRSTATRALLPVYRQHLPRLCRLAWRSAARPATRNVGAKSLRALRRSPSEPRRIAATGLQHAFDESTSSVSIRNPAVSRDVPAGHSKRSKEKT